jgi:hypothetical protein
MRIPPLFDAKSEKRLVLLDLLEREEMTNMWTQTYRHHFIMAFPSFDTATRKWRAQADISWCLGNGRDSTFVRYRHHAKTETEPVHFALQQSIEWVDRKLTLYER